jgi:hypothetical protein
MGSYAHRRFVMPRVAGFGRGRSLGTVNPQPRDNPFRDLEELKKLLPVLWMFETGPHPHPEEPERLEGLLVTFTPHGPRVALAS